jgi:hypothetical protein
MNRSVTAPSTRATSIDIDRAYQRLLRLRKLVAQADSADPAMTRSDTAPLTRATSIDIDRAYRQLQHLRKLAAQADSADKARRIVNRTRDRRHSSWISGMTSSARTE